MSFILISGRTLGQGRSKECGKLSKEYLENVATIEMNREDMINLKIRDYQNVRLSSSVGSIVVKVKSKKDLRKGLIFIPYGPWANYLIPSNTDSVGMPPFKGIKVDLKPTKEETLDLFKFLSSSYKKKGVVNNP